MMASVVRYVARADERAVDAFDRLLAVGSAAMLAALAVALVRGYSHWGAIGPSVWAHIATIAVALALTPVMLLRPRGTRRHRLLGYVWCGAMMATALISFNIRLSRHGGFSAIHLLSAWTLIQVPVIVLSARAHQVVRHRRSVRGMALGALLIAGFFTFPFGRLLGRWLFG